MSSRNTTSAKTGKAATRNVRSSSAREKKYDGEVVPLKCGPRNNYLEWQREVSIVGQREYGDIAKVLENVMFRQLSRPSKNVRRRPERG